MTIGKEKVLGLRSVSVALKRRTLLQDVSLDLLPGAVLSVIGPNGAGKTTLLRVVGGDWQASDGDVLIAGKSHRDWPLRQLACKIAALAQQSPLNFPFRVGEVVAMGRLPHTSGWREDQAIVNEWMATLDVLHLQNTIYTRLSGGEKQRVQLARVIAQIQPLDADQPKLLLLDEPCNGLDLKHQKQLAEIIADLRAAGVAVVVSAHDLNWTALVSDQILALKAGRVQAYGTTEEVLQAQQLETLYGLPVHVRRDSQSNKTQVQWL